MPTYWFTEKSASFGCLRSGLLFLHLLADLFSASIEALPRLFCLSTMLMVTGQIWFVLPALFYFFSLKIMM